jgi:hypothetical protein
MSLKCTIGKRIFFKNNSDCLCRLCRIKETSLRKYGTESPNQFGEIKTKQQNVFI